MSKIGIIATAFAALLLLSSCAPSAIAVNSPSPSPSPSASGPAFLISDQLGVDRLPDGVAAHLDVDADSTRFQGNWDQHEVFLGLKRSGTVCLVTGLATDTDSWGTGCGDGDEVVTSQLSDGAIVKYLPMATSTTPQGWTRLSDFVFAM